MMKDNMAVLPETYIITSPWAISLVLPGFGSLGVFLLLKVRTLIYTPGEDAIW